MAEVTACDNERALPRVASGRIIRMRIVQKRMNLPPA